MAITNNPQGAEDLFPIFSKTLQKKHIQVNEIFPRNNINFNSIEAIKNLEKNNVRSWVDLLMYRARHQPDRTGYIFLGDGDRETARLTYQELDTKARAIAAYLQSQGMTNDRALLVYPPGLEFITAFFGCLYAGILAIPVNAPRPNRPMLKLQAIIADADVSMALSTESFLHTIQPQLKEYPDLGTLNWIATCTIGDEQSETWQPTTASCDTLAFLQYTSGSTGKPKGVMVSHGNLFSTAADNDYAWKHNSESVMVTWLPTFHDMGLIYGLLQPLYKGFPVYMMSPLSFVQRPYLWLKAISRLRATHSGGPNFAYDLCIRRITKEQRATLDLSSWQVALNGSEPVSGDILQKFVETFEPCGFKMSSFCQGYGLAEATLKVTATRKEDVPTFYKVDAEALAQNRIVQANGFQCKAHTLIGCGYSEINAKIVIVHPENLTCCAPLEVGEVWVSSTSVAGGYWGLPEETIQTFHAYLKDTGDGPFLRTGDLGFFKDGELFVTGRIKDVLIIRGNNFYPQDIERTVEQSHPALRSSCGAAFTVEVQSQERLVIVHEIERTYLHKLDAHEVVGNICQALKVEHELEVYTIVLLKTGTIPKTSSGKIQRQACRTKFLEKTLDSVYLLSNS
ncbi:fatty acyl-AMP ligase [Scytonema sp. NUACC21]